MLINEKWKRVTGFPDYEVSNTGLIKSYKKNSNGVNIIPSDNGNGYLKLSLCKQG